MTDEALDKSIAHWEENHDAAKYGRINGLTLNSEDCALCGVYYEKECVGCPVSNNTDEPYCWNTPYRDVVDAHLEWAGMASDDPKGVYEPGRIETEKACGRMLEFLKGLKNG